MKKIRNLYRRLRWKALLWLVDREWTADLLWNADDPEHPVNSVEELHWDYYGGDGPIEVEVQRAISLPNRRYLVTPIPDPESDDIDYELTRVR